MFIRACMSIESSRPWRPREGQFSTSQHDDVAIARPSSVGSGGWHDGAGQL